MTIKQCDCCGKVIRDFNSDGKLYAVCITEYAPAFPSTYRFEVCTNCKNKIWSMREEYKNDD